MPLFNIAKKLFPALEEQDSDAIQYGAIPYKIIGGEVVFLMITSRRSANWVFPKGSPIKGLTPAQTALRESFEEAGIRGEIVTDPIGSYTNPDNKDPERLDRVFLFPMHVTGQVENWPEEEERFRHWALLPQVKQLLANKQAARLASELERRLLAQHQAPGKSRISA